MPKPLLTTPPAGPRHAIVVTGDSLSENPTLMVPMHLMWPAVLQGELRAAGARVRVRNHARNGSTTTQMLARMATYTEQEQPKVGIMFGGVNDPSNGITGATTQANIESYLGQLLDGGTDYGLVVSTQYLNWSTGGDTTTTPGSTYATLRTFQQAAANALAADYPGRVAYVDLYGYMRQLIVGGVYAQGDFAWHTVDANQHLNAAGEAIVADAVYAAIVAQDGWLADLRA